MVSTETSPAQQPSTSLEHQQSEDVIEQEQKWASGGELLASAKYSEKVIEAKERQLQGLIYQNYSRIKDVEKELAGLQLQLKLTNGPKRSALELLRRKIETQNEKVAAARNHHQRSKEVAAAAEQVLLAEERVKDQLCQELNLLIQESAHAQLEKLDQLTRRLELLNRDLTTAEVDLAADDSAVQISVRPAPTSPSHAAQPSGTSTNPFEGQSTAQAGTRTSTLAGAPEGTSSASTTDDEKLPRSTSARERAREDARKKATEAKVAAAARARHVQLPLSRPAAAPSPSPSSGHLSGNGSTTQSSGAFRAFDV